MEVDELENQIWPPNVVDIKQELLDNNETGNLCDSVEKQVDETQNAGDIAASIKCVFCSQNLTSTDYPKLLECLHIACGSCITAKLAELDRSMQPVVCCCVCNMNSQNEYIIDNQFLIEQCTNDDSQSQAESDSKAIIKCSSCSDDANATSWCVDCSEFICDSCVQAHQRLKITKEHTIKSKDEATVENSNGATLPKSILCPIHVQEKLSLFCETCDRLTCRDCQLVDHRDHKYKFANEIAIETRTSLSALLSEISYKRVLLTSAMKVIDDRQSLITEKKKELVKEITQMVVKLTNTVNQRGKQLVLRLNEVCDGKLKVLNEKKDALELLSGHTDHCIDFVKVALDKGSDSAVLYSKKTLSRHLQKVKCQRADIPNPEIPVRIQIQLGQVQELQKVIAQLGQIIVDGKQYPPPPNSVPQNPLPPNRQQPSPNMVPPMRPNIPPGMSPMSAGVGGTSSGYTNGPPMYNNTAVQQQQQQQQQQPPYSNMQMNRSFSQEGIPSNNYPVRFPGMGPHQMSRQGTQPHVSSSTHPQNISLRGLLNTQNQQQNQGQSPIMGGFSGPPNYNMSPGVQPGVGVVGVVGGPSQQSPNVGHPQMRQQHFLGGPPQHQNFGQGQTPPSNANYMAGNGPRFPNFPRMQTHPGAIGGLPQQGPGPTSAAMRPMMQNVKTGMGGFTAQQQQNFLSAQQQQQAQLQAHQQQAHQQQQQQQQQHQQQQQQQPSQQQLNAQQTQQQQQQQQMNIIGSGGLQWHIPQSMQQQQKQLQQQSNGFSGPQGQSPLMQFHNSRPNENSFKISLKSPNTMKNSMANGQTGASNTLPNVTSTNPKTPSPSTNDNAKDFTDSIDKACEESVNDLMATIAKLDSNGVQVLPEGRSKATSPQVHSSTDMTTPIEGDKSSQKDDPNEDWCAVCMDGGELMCCDKCPKVFHQNCHIPPISALPDESESWQCLLCVNFADLPPIEHPGDKRPAGLSPIELKILQRILLELYCQYDHSLPFRELEPSTNGGYYRIICSPMSLEMIRAKINYSNPHHYTDVSSFLSDVKLLFNNVYLYYQVNPNEDSKIYNHAKFLESFFYDQVAKWLPKYPLHEEPTLTAQVLPPLSSGEIINYNNEEDLFNNPAKKQRKTMDDELIAE